ncbi:MAG: hypothetical protein AAGG69_13345 [Pseudomonadota bacterium]
MTLKLRNRSAEALKRAFLAAFAILAMGVFAKAEGVHTGTWEIARTPNGPTLIKLDLFDTGRTITGAGDLTNDWIGPHAPGTLNIEQAFRSDAGFEIQVRAFAISGTIRPVGGRIAFENINGPFAPGFVSIGGEGGEMILRRAGTTPPPAPQPPVVAGRPVACTVLEQEAQFVNNTRADLILDIRGIYANNGLAFGGQETQAKCSAALNELRNLVASRPNNNNNNVASGENRPECRELVRIEREAARQLPLLGMEESGTFAAIRQTHGLPGGGAPGNTTAANCAAAIPEMQAYLNDLRRLVANQQSNTSNPFRREQMRIVGNGSWRPSNGGNAMSLWNHNNSQMAWEVGPGNRRSIWYWNPRSGLRDVGVVRGTLLFEGQRNGQAMSGEARLYTRNCGVWVYRVSGPIGPNDTTVTMRGQRPVVNANCQVTGTRDDVLNFNFLARSPNDTAQRPQPQPQPIPNDEPLEDTPGVGVWVNMYVTTSDLNVRSGPGSSNRVVGQLPRNAREVLVIGGGCTNAPEAFEWSQMSTGQKNAAISRSWCNIQWRGLRGWVWGQYLRVM